MEHETRKGMHERKERSGRSGKRVLEHMRHESTRKDYLGLRREGAGGGGRQRDQIRTKHNDIYV